MDGFRDVIELIALMVAIGGVIGVVYLLLTKHFEFQRETHLREWNQKKAKDYLPIQMQAYERLILFLERIHPERLVFRVNKPGMSARLMQSDVLKVIRDEFDHNLTQQLYISNEAWASVIAAKEETIKILNKAAENTPKDGTSLEFSAAILQLTQRMTKAPTDVAAEILKAEFRRKL